MTLLNETTGQCIARRATLLTSLTGRFLGAMGRTMEEGEAIGITSCNWVHTFFVPTALDLLFCNKEGKVLLVVHSLASYRFSPYVNGATIVYELPGGSVKTTVKVGHVLRLVK